jgi:hypothetical protein
VLVDIGTQCGEALGVHRLQDGDHRVGSQQPLYIVEMSPAANQPLGGRLVW